MTNGSTVQALQIMVLISPDYRESADQATAIYYENLRLQCDAFCNSLATLSHLRKLKLHRIQLRNEKSPDMVRSDKQIGALLMTSISVVTQLE